MSLRINTNVTAMNALRNLDQTSNQVATSIQRLSSGLRINSASDDPAGLIISEGLQAQVEGINQAVANAQDGNNLIKTAEGGLSEVNSLLRSIRQLAVHAANTGVNDATAVQADQTQINSALASIDRIASQTQFGTKKLLDGTSGTTAAVTDTARLSSIYIGGTVGGAATQAGAVTVTVTTQAARASVSGGVAYAGGVNSTIGLHSTAGGTIVINGQSINVSASDTVQTMLDRINAVADQTHVAASFDTSANKVMLSQRDYGASWKIDYSESAGVLLGANSTVASGTNAVASVQVGGASAVTFTGGQNTGDSGLRLTDTSGNSILLTEQGNTEMYNSAKGVGVVTANSLSFQIGANAGQFENLSISSAKSAQLGSGISSSFSDLKAISVSTSTNANETIKVVDEAIRQVSVMRAQLGAFQKNTLQSTISYLGVSAENLSASESQIRDTNVAQEVTSLTKAQILQQAGTSVLAQANSAPQLVLRLLQ